MANENTNNNEDKKSRYLREDGVYAEVQVDNEMPLEIINGILNIVYEEGE